MPINVYFYSLYRPRCRTCKSGLIAAVCAGSARNQLRDKHPGCKYLTVHRVPELGAVYDPSTGEYVIDEK